MDHFTCELQFQTLAREISIPVSIRCSKCRNHNTTIHDCNGIIDTGATSSMLTESIANDLGLIPSGTITVSGVHGAENANLYVIDIILGNHFILPDIPVSGAKGDAGFDLLIGMDILSKGEIRLSNQKEKTVFQFGIPSIHRMDLF